LKKNAFVTILLFILTIALTFTTLLPRTQAVDVEITFVSPETHSGKVGETVNIIGTINKTDGLYQIWFDNFNVTGHAIGNEVNVTFAVPPFPGGNYTITLQDVDMNVNATTWFFIETTYHIASELPPEPEQLQQVDSVVLHMNITGGEPNTVYYANVTVKIPYPLNDTYSAMVELTNTTDTGYGYANIWYPNETLFQPSGSHTNYTGLYYVYFNETQYLAEHSFFIGLTNASDYHRNEFVEIIAVGYQPNETATMTITYLNTNQTLPTVAVNASEHGIINATWMVPWNASIGDYNLTVTSEATKKPIGDSQLFRIPGYQIDFYPRNLAGEVVPQILVETLDKATNITYTITSETDGLARLLLEKGNHTLKAFWNRVKVNETQITITGKDTFNLTCELTSVKITVEDENRNLIPFVSLNVNYQYVTTKEDKVENGSITGETDLSGVFSLNSTLPRINYTIDASRYQIVFNTNNNTIENLPAQDWFAAKILCPSRTLTLNITEHHRNPLPNARVELIEQMGGISYNGITNDAGIAAINCTFGRYGVRVYVNSVVLNGTFVEVFNDTDSEIYCKRYNLTVSIKIVDYFGQPIPNANVTMQREDLAPRSSLTQSEGTVTFDNVIGGSLQIAIYLSDQTRPCAETTFSVDDPKVIEIKLEKYVMLAGFLIETSQLTTTIVIAASVILVLFIEIYRRKRIKPQKSSS